MIKGLVKIWYLFIMSRFFGIDFDMDKLISIYRKFRIDNESWRRKRGILTTPDRERAIICYKYTLDNNWTEKDMSYLGTMLQYSNYFEAVNYFSAKMEGKTHEECLVELC